MTILELKAELQDKQEAYIKDVLGVLKADPNLEDDDRLKTDNNTEQLQEYLEELQDKDGSLLKGIVCALERYLDK